MPKKYEELSGEELQQLDSAVGQVWIMAKDHAYKRPKMTTLLEEIAELILVFRNKHHDPAELELKQIASIAINLLWQLQLNYDINNIKSHRKATNV